MIVLLLPAMGLSQCTTSNATSCKCSDSVHTDCYLLPDIIIGEPPVLATVNQGLIEFLHTGNGVNDGRLRLSVSTPNLLLSHGLRLMKLI